MDKSASQITVLKSQDLKAGLAWFGPRDNFLCFQTATIVVMIGTTTNTSSTNTDNV